MITSARSTGMSGATGLTGGDDMTPIIPKLKIKTPRNMSKLMQQQELKSSLATSNPVSDLDATAKGILGGNQHILQDALVEKLREMGIKVKTSDISVAGKIVNTETDDLIEKHLLPSTSDRTEHHSTLQHSVDSAIFLESGETIESVESACGPLYSTMVDKGVDGMLPGSKSIGCDKKLVEEADDTAKGHIRLGNGAAKSDFMLSINAHNHATNVAIQSVLNKLTPQEIVNALRKVTRNSKKETGGKIGLVSGTVTPHEKTVASIVKSKYSLEMEKSQEEDLHHQVQDINERIVALSTKIDDSTAHVERLKDGMVLMEDNVKQRNFTYQFATKQFQNCIDKLTIQRKKINSFKLEEQAADATLEQSNGFDGINSNAVKQQTKFVTRKIHREANALRKDIEGLQYSCERRNTTFRNEKREFTKAVVELAKLRREIRTRSAANGRNIALLHLIKMQEKMLSIKLERTKKTVLHLQTAVVDQEAKRRRLEIAYEESKVYPKTKNLEKHAVETCSDIKTCGGCLLHNSDITDGEQCGWCNGRCYDGNKDGPFVGDVCVNAYQFGGLGKCPKKELIGTHDAPSPLSVKDGMDDDTLANVKKHVQQNIATFKKAMNEKYGNIVATAMVKKHGLSSKEHERLHAEQTIKNNVAKEDRILNWNRKQALIRLAKVVSARLRALRYANAAVAKLEAQLASERALVDDSVSDSLNVEGPGVNDDSVVGENKLRAKYAMLGVDKLQHELQIAVQKEAAVRVLYNGSQRIIFFTP